MRAFIFSSEDLRPFETWDKNNYTRNCLFRSQQFELILICWRAGQKTSIHCHGGEQCWIKMLEGELNEIYYRKNDLDGVDRIGSRLLKNRDHSYIDDRIGLHQLENSSGEIAMSLHLYAQPIDECSFYNEDERRFFRKRLVYDNSTATIDMDTVLVG